MTRPKPNAHHRKDGQRQHTMPEPTSDLEARYIATLTAEGLSAQTIRQRVYLLRGLGKPPSEVTQEDLVALLNGRDLSIHSRAAYIAVLRAVFSDLGRMGLVFSDPTFALKKPRTPRRNPRPLTQEQLAALERLPRDRPEYAWTILGAYAGLRAGEVCSIAGTALQDGQHGPVIRVVGKGRLDALIPAHPKVVDVLAGHAGNPQPLWPSWPQSLNRAWQRAASEVGVTGVVFHQLRHTFATRLTRAEVDLLTIAALCRHASVATTQRYAAVAEDAPFKALGAI